MKKHFFSVALALFALTSITALNARAQSCPISDEYGSRSVVAVNKSLKSDVDIKQFTTANPNEFISEKAGLKRSASYLNINAAQFVAKLETLEREGLALIKKQRSFVSYLGEIAELNVESNPANSRFMNANHASRNASGLNGLDRKTEVHVYEGLAREKGYYRVSLLSWFVDASTGQKVVDYDAIVLMKPGQTAVFKLASDYEVKRSGSARSYVAVTLRSVNHTGLASR